MTEVLKPGSWDKSCQRCHERVSAILQCENFSFVLGSFTIWIRRDSYFWSTL